MLPNTPEYRKILAVCNSVAKTLVEIDVPETEATLVIKDLLYRFAFESGVDEKDCYAPATEIITEQIGQRDFEAIKNIRKFKTLYDSIADYPDKIHAASDHLFRLPGLLGEASGGVRGGEIATIVARSGAYKTCFLENLCIYQARELARNELPGIVLLFSFEMPEEGITERAVQAVTKKTIGEVVSASANPPEWAQLITGIQEKDVLEKIYCYYGEPLALAEIETMVRDMSPADRPVQGICIDYLGYIQTKGPGSRYEKISDMARELKTGLARKLNIPVIVLSQANRVEGKDGTEEITLASARDSGAIEESSDFLYGLWKEEREDDVPQLWGRILKERRHFATHGAMNPYFQVEFQPAWMLVQDVREVRRAQVPSQQRKSYPKGKEV